MLFSTKTIAENKKHQKKELIDFLQINYSFKKYDLCLKKIRENKENIISTTPEKVFIYALTELHLLVKLNLSQEASQIINHKYNMPDLNLNLLKKIELNFKLLSPIAFFEDIFIQLYNLSHQSNKTTYPDQIDKEAASLPVEATESNIQQLAHYIFHKDYYLKNDLFYNEILPIIYYLSNSSETDDSIDEFMGIYTLELIRQTKRDQGADSKNQLIMITEARLIQYYERKNNQEMLIKIGFDLSKYTIPTEYRKNELFLTAQYNFLFALAEQHQQKTSDLNLFEFITASAKKLFPEIIEQYYEKNKIIYDPKKNIDELYKDYIENISYNKITQYYPIENLYYYIKGTQGIITKN